MSHFDQRSEEKSSFSLRSKRRVKSQPELRLGDNHPSNLNISRSKFVSTY